MKLHSPFSSNNQTTMARKKTQEEINQSKAETPVEEPETKVADVEEAAENEVIETVKKELDEVATYKTNSVDNPEPSKKSVEEPKKVEIPDYADRLLKMYSDCPEIYVAPSGSVFTPDTKPAIRGNAILYKNPYYNN